MFKGKKCKRCEEKIKDSFDFCPYCGLDLSNPEKDMQDFGMLGKGNHIQGYPLAGGMGGFGMTDKMINSLVRSLMKNLDKQMRMLDSDVQTSPRGIKIKFGVPHREKNEKKQQQKRVLTEAQIKKMSDLPRAEAKTNVRRLSDKVVYELKTNGLESSDDVFVSKLESGYEVKAIGDKKIYVNSIPVNLPLKGFSVTENGLKVEFGLH
jgi:hypothetical protein